MNAYNWILSHFNIVNIFLRILYLNNEHKQIQENDSSTYSDSLFFKCLIKIAAREASTECHTISHSFSYWLLLWRCYDHQVILCFTSSMLSHRAIFVLDKLHTRNEHKDPSEPRPILLQVAIFIHLC